MRYLLDTNVAVDYFTGRYPAVIRRFHALTPEDLSISAIAVAELRFGAAKSGRPQDNHRRIDRFLEDVAVLDFDLAASVCYGELRNDLERTGRLIGANDLLIAAQALSASLTLVTDNESEFNRVTELAIENWRAE